MVAVLWWLLVLRVWLNIVFSPSAIRAKFGVQQAVTKYQSNNSDIKKFEVYRFNSAGYIKDILGWEPWDGKTSGPDVSGQLQICQAYDRVLWQQWQKHEFENDRLSADDLKTVEPPHEWLENYNPDKRIRNWIRVESGHGIGKTKLSSGLFNHFFDCFESIIYTFAPTYPQVNNLLWKEIRIDRQREDAIGFTGTTPRLTTGNPKRFAAGFGAGAGNKGSEKFQGQHAPALLFLVDEAEGVAAEIFNAIRAMQSGVFVVTLMVANPRSRTSTFHKLKGGVNVQSYRVSSLDAPNVVLGKSVIEGGADREQVLEYLEDPANPCGVVEKHNENQMTFSIPWYYPERIYRPTNAFMWRILGFAPMDATDNVYCPLGRYRSAAKRDEPVSLDEMVDRPNYASMGVDVARYGLDNGTIFYYHMGHVHCYATLEKLDTNVYREKIKALASELVELGVTELDIRIDGTGGWHTGVTDPLKIDEAFFDMFEHIRIIEVNFNNIPMEEKRFRDAITEIYYHGSEAIGRIAIHCHTDALERDICERTYKIVTYRHTNVGKLQAKEEFRRLHMNSSPDEGDGLMLAIAPGWILDTIPNITETPIADPGDLYDLAFANEDDDPFGNYLL